ncbi:hypothetical protein BGX34_012225 [Mortierella sp. NVP85]|nr:hypothetical protein BGX34_012225 [Mortierella sp. NVP85]
MSTSHLHPFELPEILQSIASYVPDSSLSACARVSKTWHQGFIPFIWRDVRLQDCLPEAARAYSDLIRTLHISYELPQEHIALRCPNLSTLDIEKTHLDSDRTEFILEHPSLTCLKLDNCYPKAFAMLWEKILGLYNLKDLTVIGMTICREDAHSFWQVCTRLERLDINFIKIDVPHYLLSVEFPRIQNLRISNPREEDFSWILKFLQNCPNLATWYLAMDDRIPPELFAYEFAEMVSARTWPYLERVETWTCTMNLALSKIMAGMQRITSLKFPCMEGNFGPDCMEPLRSHFSNVKELNLRNDKGLTSSMAQEILSSCSILEVLKVHRIDATDVAAGRPWVCLRLKNLAACFRFDPTTIDDLQPLVFDQLSRLLRLEQLHVDGRPNENGWEYPDFQETLDLRLEKGLDKLSTIRSLCQISFRNTLQKMTEEEIKWMLQHWPRLSQVRGQLNYTKREFDQALLRKRLLRRGIDA